MRVETPNRSTSLQKGAAQKDGAEKGKGTAGGVAAPYSSLERGRRDGRRGVPARARRVPALAGFPRDSLFNCPSKVNSVERRDLEHDAWPWT
jgi:hypothetical protein